MENNTPKLWKVFLISDIFFVSGTTTTKPSDLINFGKTPRITCASLNNGIDNFYENLPTENGGVITVESATFGCVLYQSCNFIATDHVEKLELKNCKYIDKFLGLFLVTAIKFAISGKYGYGYKFSQTRIKKQKIMLPIDNNGDPDFQYMRNYMKNLEHSKLNKFAKFKTNF